MVGQTYFPEWKVYEPYKGRWKSSIENGVAITRCPHYVPSNPTGKRRMAHHMSFASSAYPPARAARREFRPDMVFTVAPSMIAVPVARRMVRRAGVPLWLHIQHFEVGPALATGLIEQGSNTAAAAARFKERLLRAADVVSTLSQPMCALAMAKSVDADRIVEIRSWANHADRIATGDGRRLRAERGLSDKVMALSSGNIANKQGLEIVIEAARRLEHRADLALVISGEGPNRARLEALAAGFGNIQFHDLQPEENIGDLMRLADIHLLPQLPDAADLVQPSKLGNMLAAGRPIVATAAPGTGIDRAIEGAGVVVLPQIRPHSPGASTSFCGIRRCANDSDRAGESGPCSTGRRTASSTASKRRCNCCLADRRTSRATKTNFLQAFA